LVAWSVEQAYDAYPRIEEQFDADLDVTDAAVAASASTNASTSAGKWGGPPATPEGRIH